MRLQRINADGTAEYAFIRRLRARDADALAPVTAAVAAILSEVRRRGDDAVREYSARFDGYCPEGLEMDVSACRRAYEELDGGLRTSLERAADRIRAFHSRAIPQSWVRTGEDGVVTGQRVRPLDRVGVYVPGGRAAYPSSVLMNVLPAKCAGVREVVMTTPPGGVEPAVLAAACIAGVDRVFCMGGAQAVAALAYGTETVPAVDKIVGPGNIYVAEAKRQVYGVCGIDMIAGPSEILVMADNGADPAYAAADLLSQAEHDPMASALLLCFSADFADRVEAEIERQLRTLSRREIIERSLADYGACIVCRDGDEAVALANALAPEHLEVLMAEPLSYLGRIDNAGSVFLGEYAPEPFGDYMAGPNHVLPTGGRARFFSPLSSADFVKSMGYICGARAGLAALKDDIERLAESEGFTAHANSIKVRFE